MQCLLTVRMQITDICPALNMTTFNMLPRLKHRLLDAPKVLYISSRHNLLPQSNQIRSLQFFDIAR